MDDIHRLARLSRDSNSAGLAQQHTYRDGRSLCEPTAPRGFGFSPVVSRRVANDFDFTQRIEVARKQKSKCLIKGNPSSMMSVYFLSASISMAASAPFGPIKHAYAPWLALLTPSRLNMAYRTLTIWLFRDGPISLLGNWVDNVTLVGLY